MGWERRPVVKSEQQAVARMSAGAADIPHLSVGIESDRKISRSYRVNHRIHIIFFHNGFICKHKMTVIN